MKKKGFTLVELLAVIVILAVIALIATPMIMDVIEKSRRGAAIESVNGILEAAENYQLESMLEGEEIERTIDLTSDILTYKGSKPSSGTLVIGENNQMRVIAQIGKYCIQKDYDDESPKVVDKEECRFDSKVTIMINGNRQEKEIGTSTTTTIDLLNEDISNVSNVSCNNSAVPTLENNTLTIDNIMMETTCYINDSLESTIQRLDNSTNTILMVNDDTNDVLYKIQNKEVILNLNGKKIENNQWAVFHLTNSNFTINDNGNGYIIGGGYIIYNQPSTYTTINGGNYVVKNNSATFGNYGLEDQVVQGIGTLTLNNVNVNSSYNGIEYTSGGIVMSNGLNVEINNSNINVSKTAIDTISGTIIINDSSIVSSSNKTIQCKKENCIYQINDSYIANTGNSYGIYNEDGSIDINGKEVVLDNDTYVNGMYIISNYHPIFSHGGTIKINGGTVVSDYVIWNGHSKIYINGGTLKCGFGLGTSDYDGYIYFNGGTLYSGKNGMIGAGPTSHGKIYLCKGNFYSSDEGIKNETSNVTIYYKDSINWNDGELPPISGSYSSQILKDNTITCE